MTQIPPETALKQGRFDHLGGPTMNVATQSKISYSDSLKARKMHLNGLINLVKPRTGKTTKIETMTIAVINAEISVIEQQLHKRG